MFRNTSRSLVILSLSGALSTGCVESKCSLPEFACDSACIPNDQVTPSMLSLAQDVESTISVKLTQCGWFQERATSIVQGQNEFQIPQVDSTGEIKVKLGNIPANGSAQLQPGKAALKVGDYRFDGFRLTPRFASQALTQDLPSTLTGSSIEAVGLVSFYDAMSPARLQSQILLLSSKDSALSMVTYGVPGSSSTGVLASAPSGLTAFSDSLPNTLAVGTKIAGFISSVSNKSYLQSWMFSANASSMTTPIASSRVSSLATDSSSSLYANINGGKTEAFSDFQRITSLTVPAPDMQTARYLALVGDLDNDKRGDVVSWDASGRNPVVLLRDPKGGSSLLPDTKFKIPDVSIDSKAAKVPVALGDLDGDGYADLVNATQDGIQIYYNNGDGTFLRETAAIGPLQKAKSVQALAIAVPTKEGAGVRGLVWVATDSEKTTLNVLKY